MKPTMLRILVVVAAIAVVVGDGDDIALFHSSSDIGPSPSFFTALTW